MYFFLQTRLLPLNIQTQQHKKKYRNCGNSGGDGDGDAAAVERL